MESIIKAHELDKHDKNGPRHVCMFCVIPNDRRSQVRR